MDLKDFCSLLEELAASHLRTYTERLKVQGCPTLKEFNDPVWQTIVLEPDEVALLDSPLWQRLRYIRQLGVAHWVYPGTTHTRFEHTLGTVHQIQRVIDSLNTPFPDGDKPIPKKESRLLRLTMLCHDIGHAAMSHVSENALNSLGQSEDICTEFAQDNQIESIKLSEAASFVLVGSPAFRELLEFLESACGPGADDTIKFVQRGIIGHPISNERPLLQELVNGPFDADKLDYLTRDARMAGVPEVTDVARLIRKLRAVRLNEEQLPEQIADAVQGGETYYWFFGVALSGGRTLDELMLARTLLFDKIYRHQKVRSAEKMVEALLSCLSLDKKVDATKLVYSYEDDALIRIGSDSGPRQSREGRVAADIARRLRLRQLFIRAIAFSQTMYGDPYKGETEQRQGLERFIRHAGDWSRRYRIQQDLAGMTGRLIESLPEASRPDIDLADLRYYIQLDPPETASRVGETERAFLVTRRKELYPFRDETAEAAGWSHAYQMARDLGYVFTTVELAPMVYLAAEAYLRKVYGVRIPDTIYSYVRVDAEQISSLRREAHKGRFYEGLPRDLWPISKRFDTAGMRSSIRDIAASMKSYSGPGGVKVDEERLMSYLQQFEQDDLIDSVAQCLKGIKLIGREEILRAVQCSLEAHPGLRGAVFCPFGEPKDSSAICTYVVNDLSECEGWSVVSLPEALAKGKLIFVDDFIGSGRQAVTIIESYLGLEPSYDLGEARGTLSEEQREAFRRAEIGFAFCAGLDEGKATLKNRLDELEVESFVSLGLREAEIPTLRSVLGEGEKATAFENHCRELGLELLGDDPKKAKRALGYGNLGLLLAFLYNTPAQTLTCFWASGEWRGHPWEPLLPRRKKR